MPSSKPPSKGGPVAALLRDREVVPRWRSPATGVPGLAVQRSSSRPITPRTDYWLHVLRERANSQPTSQHLHELAATQYALGLPVESSDALDAVLLATNGYRGKSDLLEDEQLVERSEFEAKVMRLKAAVRLNPLRPLAWTELSRAYLSIGQPDQAKRAMQCAIHTGGLDRYVTRSATRLWFQLGEVERAQHMLARHPRVRHDPWLLAAEVACMSVQSKTSRLIGVGKQMLESKRHSPRDSSELAAALATVEHRFGSRKQASRLFAESLRQPTDNALAQAQWAKNADAHLKIPQTAWAVPSAFEAAALSARVAGDWGKVGEATQAWLNDEPFSLQAAALGSIVSFEEDQFPQAVQMATHGLRAYPHAVLLLNNRAVVHAYMDDLKSARSDIDQALACPEGRTEPYLLATVGLLAYRSGDSISGAMLYEQAMRWYSERKEPVSALLAALYWAYEEVLQGSPEALALRLMLEDHVHRIGNKDSLPEMKALLARIDSALETDCGVRASGLFDGIGAEYMPKFDIPERVRTSITNTGDANSKAQALARLSDIQTA